MLDGVAVALAVVAVVLDVVFDDVLSLDVVSEPEPESELELEVVLRGKSEFHAEETEVASAERSAAAAYVAGKSSSTSSA